MKKLPTRLTYSAVEHEYHFHNRRFMYYLRYEGMQYMEEHTQPLSTLGEFEFLQRGLDFIGDRL